MVPVFTNAKKSALKKWSKLNASIYTKLFVLCSILQCIIIIVLQFRILFRNLNFTSAWTTDYLIASNNNFSGEGCQQFAGRNNPRFPFLAYDNMIFILFQAFQLYFCFNAIFHEHIIQILTITKLNFCWALYGTVQAVEVKISLGDLDGLSKCANQQNFSPNFSGHDIPCVIVLLLFAIVMSYLSYKLYKQFGWVNYKKIGGDTKMRCIYKQHLIFLMLLKLNLLAVLLFMIPSLIITLVNNWQYGGYSALTNSVLTTGFLIIHLVVTILVLILEILAYRFVATENRSGMKIFLVLWIAVIVDFVFAMICAFIFFIDYKSYWYFGIIILTLLIVNSVLLFVFGVKVLNSFGYGLKERLNKDDDQDEVSPQTPVPLVQIWDDLEAEQGPKKWTIDD